MSDLLPIELWKSALMTPKETFAREKANADLVDGAKQLAVGGAIAGLVLGLISFNPIAMVVSAVGLAILVPIGLLFGHGVYWILAKLLGGKGSYSTQYYLRHCFSRPCIR